MVGWRGHWPNIKAPVMFRRSDGVSRPGFADGSNSGKGGATGRCSRLTMSDTRAGGHTIVRADEGLR